MKNKSKILWPVFIIILSLAGIFIYEQGKSKSVQVIDRVKEVKVVSKKIVVQVDGAVKNPGVYQVSENIHLFELLVLAEPLPDADLQKFNLAEIIKDGSLFRIPSLNKEPKKKARKSVVAPVDNKGATIVNINKAGLAELSQVPGIGASYAKKILEYRDENGYFRELNDLLKVKGIGQSKLKAMEKYITLD